MMNQHATEADLLKMHGAAVVLSHTNPCMIDLSLIGHISCLLSTILCTHIVPAELADAVQENMEHFRPSDVIVLNIGNDHRCVLNPRV